MAIGDVLLRAVASLVGDTLADSAVDRAENYASGFGLRHPRGLRFVRIVGGALLALVGLWDVVITIGAFVYVVIGEGIQLALLILLLPLGMGFGLLVWGIGLLFRGLRTGPSLHESRESRAETIALRAQYARENDERRTDDVRL